jgi:RNA polymerase primary sigma factor
MRSNNRMEILKEPLVLVESTPLRAIPRDDDRHASEIDDADDTDLDEEEEKPAVPELQEIAADELESANHGPDDALGLYLRQMGAIPLLNRANEIEVAQRLERARNRFRVGSLRCGFILRRALTMF